MPVDTSIQSQIEQARSLLYQQRYVPAIAALMGAVNADPKSAEAYELLGIAHSLNGNRAAARQALRRATEVEPGRATAHYNFALFLFEGGEVDLAAEENNTALFLAPDHGGAQTLQAKIREKLRFRDYTAEEAHDTALIGTGPLTGKLPSNEYKRLECPYCHARNYVSARVCEKCNMLIPEMAEIVPME